MKENLIVLKSLNSLNQLREYISKHDYLSVDTETTGTQRGAQLIGFSVSGDVETGYYVVLRAWEPGFEEIDYLETVCDEQGEAVFDDLGNTVKKQVLIKPLRPNTGKLVDLETLEAAAEIFTLLKSKQLIFHNTPFDCSMIEQNTGVSLIDSVHTDTMLLAHLLDENRRVGLKDLGEDLFGNDTRKEQNEMKASVEKNGGYLTKSKYELYKGDAELIGKYGAKDALLTCKLFYTLIPQLFDQKLDKFFYEETMPLLKGPTYQLNTTGLKVDTVRLQNLRGELEAENMELEALIHREIHDKVKTQYPGTKKTNIFNINSGPQRAWLLFQVLGEVFNTLTDTGVDVCEALGSRKPYRVADKRELLYLFKQRKDTPYIPEVKDGEGKITQKAKLVRDFWYYTQADVETMKLYQDKYKWVKAFMKLTKNEKLLSTYVISIQERMQYGVINPSFLQHGTTSGRYSSRNPNFQNLPRDDKRVKSCIIAREGNVLVGADYSQLEPRVFASFSKDERLLRAFDGASDFYSTIGIEVFKKFDAKPIKEGDPHAFGVKYKSLRTISKVIALSATYGTTAPKMAMSIKKETGINKSVEEAQQIIDDYFENFPGVKEFMLNCHTTAKDEGVSRSLFGRLRRIPEAKEIKRLFPKVAHEKLQYNYRNLLNLGVNHTVQSTAASIVNRAAIKAYQEIVAKDWKDVKIVLNVHDELVLEGPEALADEMVAVLKDAMENTTQLPGVKLEALPKIAKNLGDLK